MPNLIKKHPFVFELPFKIVYCIFAIFTYCNITFMRTIMSYAVIAVLTVGGLASLFRLIRIRHYIKTPGLILAFLFFVSFLISLVINLNYECSEGIKGVVWLGLHLFTIFAFDETRSIDEYKKEFTGLSLFFICVIFLMSVASIVQYFMRYSALEYFPNHLSKAGLVWGRLWGVYRDPNYASVFAIITIVFSIFYFRKFKNICLRVLFIINILTQLLYIAYSDSRTGIVCLFICSFAYSLLMFGRYFGKKNFLKTALAVVLSLVIGFGSAAICPTAQKISRNLEALASQSANEEQPNNGALSSTDTVTSEKDTTSSDNDAASPDSEAVTSDKTESSQDKNNTPPENLELRDETIEQDISNRRFDLWKSCTEIFLSKPVFGVSYYALKQYALAELPDTYFVNNDHTNFNDAHNFIFNVLAGQGIVGITILIAFAIFAMYYIFKNLSKVPDLHYEYICVLLVCIAASICSGILLSDIVYVNAPTSIMFWLFLGYIFHYIKTQKGEAK